MKKARTVVVTAAVTAIMAVAGLVFSLSGTAAASGGTNSFMYYPDINTNHQLCLGIHRANGVLASCTFVHDQAWHRGAELRHTGYYQYINAKGVCLSVYAGTRKKGARIMALKCRGAKSPSQYWAIDFASTQTYLCVVFNYHSGYVMQPVSNKKGAAVVQEPWKGHSKDFYQQWVFEINS
jgi:hypothetical protein